MTLEEFDKAGIPLEGSGPVAQLNAEAALEWLQRNTRLKFDPKDCDSIQELPAGAKLFVLKAVDLLSGDARQVTSESLEGASQSFASTSYDDLLWSWARELIGSNLLKSRISFYSAVRRWH